MPSFAIALLLTWRIAAAIRAVGRTCGGRRSAEALDIEEALRWACRDELPKRQRGGSWIGGTTWSPIRDPIDRDPNDHPEPGFPGDPHADALAIAAGRGLRLLCLRTHCSRRGHRP
jgi:hypothetical protein